MATTILNVDDREINRYIRTQTLTKAGYNVIEADGGQKAVELARSVRPQLVLLDINMPDLNGREVCHRIKTEAGLDQPVVVVHISATATATEDRVLGLEEGADGYLVEPVAPELLLATVRSMLRLYAAERAVRERDASVRRLVESNVVGIAIATLEGIKDANAEFLRMIGATEEDLAAGRVNWQNTTTPEYAAAEARAMEELRARGSCAPFEKEYIRPDGTRVPVLMGAAALRTEPLEWIGFTADLSAQKRIEKELKHRTEQLAASNEDLQRFAYAVSHDLQTPLRTVASMTELLARRSRAKADPESDELVGLILSGIERMRRLISDLLEYSRLSDQPAQRNLVDTSALAGWAVANLRAQIEDTGAVVTIDDLPKLVADDQLSRVFQNLIGNAIKYRSQARPDIRVSARREGNDWLFSVRDNAIGFEMKHAEKIFGVFQRLQGQQVEGTGIGLAICRKVIERYGGRIWAESVLGQGSTFYFTLPVRADAVISVNG